MVKRCSCSETVGLLRFQKILGHLAGTIGSPISREVDASIAISNSERFIENEHERFLGKNVGACGFTVIRRAVLGKLLESL